MGCFGTKPSTPPTQKQEPAEPAPPPIPLGHQSKYYAHVRYQHPDLRAEEIYSCEIDKAQAMEWREKNGVSPDGKCKKPTVPLSNPSDQAEYMKIWVALTEPDLYAHDYYTQLRNGAFMRLVQGVYLPLQATEAEKNKVIQTLQSLADKTVEAYQVGSDVTKTSTGLVGAWQYLLQTPEDGLFQTGQTYVAVNVKYHRK